MTCRVIKDGWHGFPFDIAFSVIYKPLVCLKAKIFEERNMHKTVKKGLSALFPILFILCASSPMLHASQAYTHTALTDRVDALFTEWDKENSPGAALGIFKDGRIIYARGYGMANLDYNIPITPRSVFRTGSIGKQFTAMCIAILAEQGKLTLDDDIRRFLPEMHEFNPPVKIKHLIHHTSGVRDYLLLQGLAGRVSGYFYTSPEVLDLLSRQKGLDFPPGSEFSYSNSGYFLLAEIVRRASGMKTPEYAKKYIFDPLGMTSSHFHDDPNMIVKNMATGYYPKEGGGFRIYMTQLDMIGDGGVFTTVEDFFKWDQNFYHNNLGRGTQDLINTVLTRDPLSDGRETDYAFGLRVGKYRGLRMVTHGGSFVGYRSHYLQFPDQHFSVDIHSNLGSFEPGRIAQKIADIYLEDQFTEALPAASAEEKQHPMEKKPEKIELSPSQKKEYAGQYYCGELDVTASVEMENNELLLKLVRTKDILTPISRDDFLSTYTSDDEYEPGKRNIHIMRDQEQKITGFLMSSGSIKNLEFIKIK